MVVTHPDFKSGDDMIYLHAVKRWFAVDNEGNKDYLFDAHTVAEQEREPEGPKEDQCTRVPPVLLEIGAGMGQMTDEEVGTVAMTINVNDYNAPSPENIPQTK